MLVLVVGVGDGDVMSGAKLLGSHLHFIPAVIFWQSLNLTSLVEPLHDRVVFHTAGVDVLEVDVVNHHGSVGRDGRTDLGESDCLEGDGRADDFFVRHDSHDGDAGLVVD